MIQSAIETLGPWNWWILAIILMGMEIFLPGTFFLWFGISAFVIGTITLAVGTDSTFWVWQTQLIGFVVLSLVAAIFGRRYMSQGAAAPEDNPNLNERGVQLIGRSGEVIDSISGGVGRARFGETTWRVTGTDVPQGGRVRVIGADGSTLFVEPETKDQTD